MIAWLRHRYTTPRTSTRETADRTRLRLEMVEARAVPAALATDIAVSSSPGATDATAQLLDTTIDAVRVRVTPFAGYRGPLSVAAGDVNGDGTADLIVGAQAPNGHVKVFDGASGAPLQSFYSFAGFRGAVNVGSADVNGDGYADVLVTASALNGHVKAFAGQNDSLLTSFYAFPGFYGKTSVSGADFDHDGRAEIIVGAGGTGVGGRVALFRDDGSVYSPGFFASPGFGGTVSVAGGDVNGDGAPDIIVGEGKGSMGGMVKVFRVTDFALVNAFLPYAPTVTTGVNVQLADANQDGGLDIMVTLQGGGNPSLSKFYGAAPHLLALNTGGPGTYSSPDPDTTANYDTSSYTPSVPDTSYTPPDTSYTPPDTSYDPGSSDPGYSDPTYPYDQWWYFGGPNYDPGPSYDPGYGYDPGPSYDPSA